MNQTVKRFAARLGAAFGALGLGTALTVTSLLAPNIQTASALTATGGQIQNRAIYLSNSTPGATATYFVSFQAATTGTIAGIVVDFCGNDPIVGDSCTAPSGSFSVGATPSVTYNIPAGDDQTGLGAQNLPGAGAAWTASSVNSGRTLKLTASSAQSVTAGTEYAFEINNVINPTPAAGAGGTFYGRLLTYASSAGAFATYAAGTEGTVVDYGGFALSTANVINITAKVQETLSFCVTNVDLGVADASNGNVGHTCGDSVATNVSNVPNLTIGHGTTVKTIDSSAVDTAPAYMQISTNATTGAVIRMHSGNTCANGGLSATGGAACAGIPGVGSVGSNSPTAANAMVAGTAAFGLFVDTGYTTSGLATSTGTVTPNAAYYNAAHANETLPDLWYGMNNTAGSGVTGTYGSVLATTAGAPCNTMNSHLVFGATASLTTPAGIYTAAESLIATGTF